MEERLKHSIKKSIDLINTGEAKFFLPGITESTFSVLPVFTEKEKNCLDSFQKRLMGFYVLRNAFRGILLSVNFIGAGDLALSKKLLGPAVSSYYTASYHILGAFLALHGRLIFDEVWLVDGHKLETKKRFAIANYSKGNWHFAGKKWGHGGRWKEIKQMNLIEYPSSFNHLFDYWFKSRIKEELTVSERLERKLRGEPPGTPLGINDIIDEFLENITSCRHHAMYSSFGSEAQVVTNLVNRDSYSDYGIDFLAKAYRNFCYEFLNENVESLIELLNFLRLHKKTRGNLGLSIYQPWFDSPNFNEVNDVELSRKLKAIWEFLFRKRQSRIK